MLIYMGTWDMGTLTGTFIVTFMAIILLSVSMKIPV
jgi:hypothetical protein